MIEDYYQKAKYGKTSGGRRRAIIKLLGLTSPAGKMLDVGCGDGRLGEEVKKTTGLSVYGTEWSLEACELARERLDKVFPLDLESKLAEWPRGLTEERFNYVLVSEVLEHLFYPEKLLENLKTLTLPESKIIITVPNFLFWKNRLKMLLGYFNYTNEGLLDRGHIHFFSWSSFREMIEGAGYLIEAESHHVPTRGTRILSRWWPGLFAYQFIVKIARK